MKILCCGDRNWKNKYSVYKVLSEYPGDTIIVHGAARGADSICGEIAKDLRFTVHAHPAKWEIYGKAAGPIRNQEMLDAHPDIELGIAFHKDIGNSKGTKDMVNRLKRRGIKVKLVTD